jgi:hypothetical protein
MERRGLINAYTPYKARGEAVFTVNLADGTTPFMAFFHGVEYNSNCYRLPRPQRAGVAFAWYRPGKEVFESLPAGSQSHVLHGGLLSAPLADALARQMREDPVEADWDFERFQKFCLLAYGRRLPPQKGGVR